MTERLGGDRELCFVPCYETDPLQHVAVGDAQSAEWMMCLFECAAERKKGLARYSINVLLRGHSCSENIESLVSWASFLSLLSLV